ncbi:MAG: glycosyltransferase [Enterococcus sp.]
MNAKMTTSVVMATYNGEKYIEAQLQSLKNQTRQLDEVLIYDDQSTDNTVAIIQSYIEKENLANWQVLVNEINQGWRLNFMKLLEAATGDIVFTCDQDDIWYEDKIEAMTELFEKEKNVSVVVSDYDELIEETGSSAKLRPIQTVIENGLKKVVFERKNVLLKRPGCVFAVRKEFIPLVVDYYDHAENSAHDLAMWASALLYDQLYYLEKPTIQFRRHATSSFQKEVNTAKKQNGIYDNRIQTLERFNVRIHSAKEFITRHVDIQEKDKKQAILTQMIKTNESRVASLGTKKFSKVVQHTLDYREPFAYFADLYHIYKIKRS